LRLRDLDGETICYTRFADDPAAVAAFGEQVFRRPWEVIGTRRILMKTWRRIRRSGTWNPINWGVIAAANLHCYLWSKGTPAANRTYRAGTDVLDPQYAEYPADITAEEFERYWAPVELIDAAGNPAEWLIPPVPARRPPARVPA
jgi:hypothetical protein